MEKQKKVLFVATVTKLHINAFHIPYLQWFKDQGWETHVAAKNDFIDEECIVPHCDHFHDVDFHKTPWSMKNYKAYKDLKQIIDYEKFNIIHCHMPVGGAIARLAACQSRKNGTKVIYTAHGFHFFKGAPVFNWIAYYPVEYWLSEYTDALITINQADYAKAQKFKAKEVAYIPGVGIDFNKFIPQTKERKLQLRKEYGYEEDNFILIYVAELSKRKNQSFLFDVIEILKDRIPSLKLLLVGRGNLLEQFRQVCIQKNIYDIVEFLGFRSDVPCLMTLSDIAVSSSKQEGLPVNLMEAMAIGLPMVVTDCRGNRDLVEDAQNGYVVDLKDEKGFSERILKIYESNEIQEKFMTTSQNAVVEYSLKKVIRTMENEIYSKCFTSEKI